MNKKISEFMPIVSVIPGETNPTQYTEESNSVVSGSSFWKDYPVPFIGEIFPEVKWQFPTMSFQEKNSNETDLGGDWNYYSKYINRFNEEYTEFLENTFAISGSVGSVINQNICSPQIFLLAPLFFICQSENYSIKGTFVNSEFIRRLLFLSFKDNLTKFNLKTPDVTLDMSNSPWINFGYSGSLPYWGWKKREFTYTLNNSGNYVFEFEVTELDYTIAPYDGYFSTQFPLVSSLAINTLGFNNYIEGCYRHNWDEGSKTYKGSFSFDVLPANVGQSLKVVYLNRFEFQPESNLKIHLKFENNYYQMHPTIELGRYLPDWTAGTYINALKNSFNLDVIIDDFERNIVLNFNEEEIVNASNEFLPISLSVDSYEQTPYLAFLLQNENDEDEALWITKEGEELYSLQTSDFLQTIKSKFKFIPNNGFTASLSDQVQDKSGIGLMIYEPKNAPFVSENYLGQTLSIPGEKGIYNSFFKIFIKFRLNGSILEMSGPISNTQLSKVLNKKRIWIDNQEYIISLLDYQETNQFNYKLKFSLVSINF
jgi:hypothetical protein